MIQRYENISNQNFSNKLGSAEKLQCLLVQCHNDCYSWGELPFVFLQMKNKKSTGMICLQNIHKSHFFFFYLILKSVAS